MQKYKSFELVCTIYSYFREVNKEMSILLL